MDRRLHAHAHAVAHLGQPGFHLSGQPGVGGKWKPHALGVFKQPRQPGVDVGAGEGLVDTQRGHGRLGTQPVAVPDLALEVLGLAEQRALPIALEHQARVGLGETGQVIEVAVMPVKEIRVAIALAQRRRGDDGHGLGSQLGSQARAALGINRGHAGYRTAHLLANVSPDLLD